MSVAEIASEVGIKLDRVREALAQEITGAGDVCLTGSCQAEDVLLTKLALEILGGPGVDDYWTYQQLRSRGNTIEAGTSEILRNIISERVLGMARSR